MPKIADIQETPNPNAVKFILKEPVSHGTSHSFPTAEAAKSDKLANSLFEVGDVVSVFYMRPGRSWLSAEFEGRSNGRSPPDYRERRTGYSSFICLRQLECPPALLRALGLGTEMHFAIRRH